MMHDSEGVPRKTYKKTQRWLTVTGRQEQLQSTCSKMRPHLVDTRKHNGEFSLFLFRNKNENNSLRKFLNHLIVGVAQALDHFPDHRRLLTSSSCL